MAVRAPANVGRWREAGCRVEHHAPRLSFRPVNCDTLGDRAEFGVNSRDPRPPQLGFNNNVKYAGRTFHIQTEDSGVNHPHITTHLFADGGRILKSQRTDYSELLGSDELAEIVRKRMKEQHKAMFLALRSGEFDPLIDAAFEVVPRAQPNPPSSSSAPRRGSSTNVNGRPLLNVRESKSGVGSSAASSAAGQNLSVASQGSKAVPQEASIRSQVAPAASRGAKVASENALAKSPASSPRGAAAEAAPASAAESLGGAASSRRQTAAVSAGEPGSRRLEVGLMGEVASSQHDAAEPSPNADTRDPGAEQDDPNVKSSVRVAMGPGVASPASHPHPSPPSWPSHPSGRYHATRPAAIFNATGPSSLFGAEPDPIDEQSLDDVILSYISEDLDTTGSE